MRTAAAWCGGMLVLGAVALTLGGCQEGMKEEHAQLSQENVALRHELAATRERVREAELRAVLAADRDRTAGVDPDVVMPTPGTSGTTGTTGFNTGSVRESSVAPLARPESTVQPTSRPGALPLTHTVAQGDSLYRLAVKYYNDGLKWTLIYDANRQVIGPDSNKLKLGADLVIPPVQAASGGSR